MSCYTHKTAIIIIVTIEAATSLHPMYTIYIVCDVM